MRGEAAGPAAGPAALSALSPEARAAQRRQARRWAMMGVLLIGLLVVFHQGFFLYVVLVVTGLAVIAWGIATLSASGVQTRRTVSESHVEIGATVDVHLILRNTRDFPAPWVLWEDQVEAGSSPELPTCGLASFGGRATRELLYPLRLTRRGLVRVGPVVLETSGPFGLVRRFVVGHDAQFITVFPRTVPIGEPWATGHRPVHEVPRRRSLFEDPTRFIGIREYRPGDSRKRIHWRATARTGRLQSRVFEPSVLEGTLLVLDMSSSSYPGLGVGETASGEAKVAALRAETCLELAVTTAASIADYVLGGGQTVGMLANGADAVERYPAEWTGQTFRRFESALAQTAASRRIARLRPVEVPAGRGGRQRDLIRTALARLVPAEGLSLAELLTAELPRLSRSLVLTLITPILSLELGAALAALSRSGFELAVVWLGKPGEIPGEIGLPRSVPVYVVGHEIDLSRLGARRL